ncbi:MAG: TrmB family transcriptional regulator [Nanoarchaeota archaeon]
MEPKLLRMLGLSEKEMEIYTELIKSGPLSILEISKRTNLNRTFCYDLIEKMIKKGILLKNKGPKNVYQAVSIEQLKILIEKAYTDSKQELERLNKIKKSCNSETEILEFKGYYSVFNLLRRILSQKDEICSFWSKNIGELFQKFLEENAKTRIEHKIPLRVLTDENDWTKKWLKNLSFGNNYRKIKYLKDFDFSNTIYIFNNEVAQITYENDKPYGIIIKNKEYFNTQKKIFNKLWELTK